MLLSPAPIACPCLALGVRKRGAGHQPLVHPVRKTTVIFAPRHLI
jgi:hypothetical protein